MSTSDRKTAAFLTGALFGGLVGSAVALLYAPQTGEETRKVIADKSVELKDRAVESGEELRQKAEEVAAQTRTMIEETASTTKDRMQEFQHRGQAFLDEQRERIRSVIESGTQPLEEVQETLAENGIEKPEPAA